MLILSRKKSQQIVIDNVIVLTVVEIRGDRVRIGIDAPQQIPVHRREVCDAISRSAKSPAKDAADGATDGIQTYTPNMPRGSAVGVTLSDAAQMLGTTTKQVQVWCDKGWLPCEEDPPETDPVIRVPEIKSFARKHGMTLVFPVRESEG